MGEIDKVYLKAQELARDSSRIEKTKKIICFKASITSSAHMIHIFCCGDLKYWWI
jgi:hypothetical protein